MDRTEVEAVANVYWPGKRTALGWFVAMRQAEKAIAALDAVRRSPQGEDHEAEAVAALYEFAQERWGWGSNEYESVRDAVDVVLSRCLSPERDTGEATR